jgi:hypothetical protein
MITRVNDERAYFFLLLLKIDVTATPTPNNYFTRGDNYYLDDPYEGELMVFFMDLFGSWADINEREQVSALIIVLSTCICFDRIDWLSDYCCHRFGFTKEKNCKTLYFSHQKGQLQCKEVGGK